VRTFEEGNEVFRGDAGTVEAQYHIPCDRPRRARSDLYKSLSSSSSLAAARLTGGDRRAARHQARPHLSLSSCKPARLAGPWRRGLDAMSRLGRPQSTSASPRRTQPQRPSRRPWRRPRVPQRTAVPLERLCASASAPARPRAFRLPRVPLPTSATARARPRALRLHWFPVPTSSNYIQERPPPAGSTFPAAFGPGRVRVVSNHGRPESRKNARITVRVFVFLSGRRGPVPGRIRECRVIRQN
jgi:hypothetical protein